MKSPLIGKTMRVRHGVCPIGGLSVKILRQSPLGTLTVRLLESRNCYKEGTEVHVHTWEVEELTGQISG